MCVKAAADVIIVFHWVNCNTGILLQQHRH